MPTLGSISIHETLRDKLRNLDKSSSSSSSQATAAAASAPTPAASANANSSSSSRPASTAITRSKAITSASIHTPQALLSRDPFQLCQDLLADRFPPAPQRTTAAHSSSSALTRNNNNRYYKVPLQQIFKLRSNIADALIKDQANQNGKTTRQIMHRLRNNRSNHNTGQRNNNKNNTNRDNVSDLRSKMNIKGSVSALDMCKHDILHWYSLDSNNNNNRSSLKSISTGSSVLDKLISPPESTARTMSQMISTSYSNHGHQYHNNSNDGYTNGGGVAGLSFGIITEATGPTSSGKTQLALTLCANALLQSHQQHNIENNNNGANASFNDIKIHYLASGGGNSTVVASTKRLFAILKSKARKDQQQQHNSSTNNNNNNNNTSQEGKRNYHSIITPQMMERVTFHIVQDGFQALHTLTQIEHEALSETQKQNQNHTSYLIIFDSANGCLTSNCLKSKTSSIIDVANNNNNNNNISKNIVTGDNNRGTTVGYGLINQVGLKLRQIAKTLHAAVFVTNGCSLLPQHQRQKQIDDQVARINSDSSSHGSSNKRRRREMRIQNYRPSMYQSWTYAHVRVFLDIIKDEYDDGRSYSNSDSYDYSSSNQKRFEICTKRFIHARLDKHYAKSTNTSTTHNDNHLHSNHNDANVDESFEAIYAISNDGIVDM